MTFCCQQLLQRPNIILHRSQFSFSGRNTRMNGALEWTFNPVFNKGLVAPWLTWSGGRQQTIVTHLNTHQQTRTPTNKLTTIPQRIPGRAIVIQGNNQKQVSAVRKMKSVLKF